MNKSKMKAMSELERNAKKAEKQPQLRTEGEKKKECRRQRLKLARHAAEDKQIMASYG